MLRLHHLVLHERDAACCETTATHVLFSIALPQSRVLLCNLAVQEAPVVPSTWDP